MTCNHDFKDKNNTLILIPIIRCVANKGKYYRCKECNKILLEKKITKK